MPHQSFGAVRLVDPAEPLTFDFGMFSEERLTVVPEPSLGDTFDLADCPEPTTPATELEASRMCARFIRRMLIPEDRPRFDQALYRIPASHVSLVIDAARWITQEVLNRPFGPAASSSDGPPTTETNSNTNSAGPPASPTSPPVEESD